VLRHGWYSLVITRQVLATNYCVCACVRATVLSGIYYSGHHGYEVMFLPVFIADITGHRITVHSSSITQKISSPDHFKSLCTGDCIDSRKESFQISPKPGREPVTSGVSETAGGLFSFTQLYLRFLPSLNTEILNTSNTNDLSPPSILLRLWCVEIPRRTQ